MHVHACKHADLSITNEGVKKKVHPLPRFGDHFSPHLDGPWVPSEEESSVFTVVIYLNSDFEGGATSFLSEEGAISHVQIKHHYLAPPLTSVRWCLVFSVT